MNVQKAMDKLTEWNNTGEKLKQHVPRNDEVLHSWLNQLEEFSQDLPFLLQLSSDALKVMPIYSFFSALHQKSLISHLFVPVVIRWCYRVLCSHPQLVQ